MDVERVELQIEEAVRDEGRSGRLRRALWEHARQHGQEAGDADLDGAVGFVMDYVRHVPGLFRDGMETARIAGLESEMSWVLESAVSYWAMAEDMIPDRLGLLGVLDDAYCSLTLLQALSDRHENETGRRLFSPDLAAANEAMRRLIGEPIASQLDMYVGSKFDADPMLQMARALTSLSRNVEGLQLPVGPGIWDGESVEEVVSTHLGAVGLA
ncbi:MAG: YkvA family protein [marine benthic group bacterium]|nr:YkvA family protein [Gemmatimonadota bacterium]MCL7986124.1 YkvA family protein [Gemmatimonadota bacterium]